MTGQTRQLPLALKLVTYILWIFGNFWFLTLTPLPTHRTPPHPNTTTKHTFHLFTNVHHIKHFTHTHTHSCAHMGTHSCAHMGNKKYVGKEFSKRVFIYSTKLSLSLPLRQTPSSGLRHPSLEEGAGKWCLDCALMADIEFSIIPILMSQCATHKLKYSLQPKPWSLFSPDYIDSHNYWPDLSSLTH